MKTRTWEEMGLKQEDLYNREKAMQYWIQYEPKEFLQDMVNALRESPKAIQAWVKVLQEEKDIMNLSLSKLPSEMTVEEICEILLRNVAEMQEKLNIMWEYSKNMKSE